jgi:hypothetical protein
MEKPSRSALARSFERHMRAENRSERTITTYLMGLRQAETFLRERPDRARCTDERECAALRPTTLEAATRADLEAFMADVLARRAPAPRRPTTRSRRSCTPGWWTSRRSRPTRSRG